MFNQHKSNQYIKQTFLYKKNSTHEKHSIHAIKLTNKIKKHLRSFIMRKIIPPRCNRWDVQLNGTHREKLCFTQFITRIY